MGECDERSQLIPSLALWLADIFRPVYSHFSPDWGPIPSYFLVPYTVEEGASKELLQVR